MKRRGSVAEGPPGPDNGGRRGRGGGGAEGGARRMRLSAGRRALLPRACASTPLEPPPAWRPLRGRQAPTRLLQRVAADDCCQVHRRAVGDPLDRHEVALEDRPTPRRPRVVERREEEVFPHRAHGCRHGRSTLRPKEVARCIEHLQAQAEGPLVESREQRRDGACRPHLHKESDEGARDRHSVGRTPDPKRFRESARFEVRVKPYGGQDPDLDVVRMAEEPEEDVALRVPGKLAAEQLDEGATDLGIRGRSKRDRNAPRHVLRIDREQAPCVLEGTFASLGDYGVESLAFDSRREPRPPGTGFGELPCPSPGASEGESMVRPEPPARDAIEHGCGEVADPEDVGRIPHRAREGPVFHRVEERGDRFVPPLRQQPCGAFVPPIVAPGARPRTPDRPHAVLIPEHEHEISNPLGSCHVEGRLRLGRVAGLVLRRPPEGVDELRHGCRVGRVGPGALECLERRDCALPRQGPIGDGPDGARHPWLVKGSQNALTEARGIWILTAA